ADFSVTVDSAAHRDTTARTTGSRNAASKTRAVSVPVHAGDWIVRLDQPYAAPVRTLLAIQTYNADDPTPYDDTGWTLDVLRGVETLKVADSSVFTRPMRMLTSDAVVTGTTAGNGSALIVPHTGDWRSAVLPWKINGAKVIVADSAFTADGATY